MTPALAGFCALCCLPVLAQKSAPTQAPPEAVVDDTAAVVDADATAELAPVAIQDGQADDREPAVDQATAEPVSPEQATASEMPASEAGPRRLIGVPAVDGRGASVIADGDAARPIEGDSDADDDSDGGAAAPPAKRPGDTGAKPAGVTFSGIPAINYIADNGLGLGLIAAAYIHDGVTAPYRTAITLQIFATTNLVQDHNVVVDSLRLFDLPLRLNARIGYLSSLTQNYCGVGGTVTCDKAVAEAAAVEAGIDSDDEERFEEFTRRFYQRRFMNPYGLVNLRYALIERSPGQPTRVEVTGGYRAFYFIPGNIFADDDGDGAPDLTPYEGSLFAKDFPDGEPGFSSVLNAGLMLDSRDQEPSPTEGWWSEGSIRATTPGLSTWNYGGFNLTVRGYTHLPIDAPIYGNLGRRLVLANRLTIDGVVGDIPIQELARLGGSQDVYAFGGADMGRGIRVQRFMGKAKLLDQAELRFRFFEFDAFEQQFALTLAAFVDSAIVADELLNPSDVGVIAAGGGAFRIAWNENFVIRVDVGVSPFEDFSPQIYITINQPF
jgi:hypothetical protein